MSWRWREKWKENGVKWDENQKGNPLKNIVNVEEKGGKGWREILRKSTA